jgi:hypothetical protein
LPDAEGTRLPKWPLQVVLSLLSLLEILFVVMLSAEGRADNIPAILNSLGLVVFCVLMWRGVPWIRWLVIAFLVWHIVGIGASLSAHFGDHRTGGSLMLIGFYVAVAVVVASPLGNVRLRAAT